MSVPKLPLFIRTQSLRLRDRPSECHLNRSHLQPPISKCDHILRLRGSGLRHVNWGTQFHRPPWEGLPCKAPWGRAFLILPRWGLGEERGLVLGAARWPRDGLSPTAAPPGPQSSPALCPPGSDASPSAHGEDPAAAWPASRDAGSPALGGARGSLPEAALSSASWGSRYRAQQLGERSRLPPRVSDAASLRPYPPPGG